MDLPVGKLNGHCATCQKDTPDQVWSKYALCLDCGEKKEQWD